MEKQYKAVIFDFDMTLADSAGVIVALLNDTAEKFGYSRLPFQEVLPCVGNTHENMLSYITGETDREKIMNMRIYYREISRTEMPRRTEFFPGTEECLKGLKSRGIKTGILSLKLKEILLASLEKHHLTGYIDQILGCEDVEAPKPDPSGLIKMLELLEIAAEEALYIGDSILDEGTARNAGVDFCAMLLGGTGEEQFDKRVVKRFYHSINEFQTDFLGKESR